MKRENQQRDPEIVKRLSLNSIERLEKAVRRFPSDTDTRHSLSDAHHTFACACQRENRAKRILKTSLTFTSNELESYDRVMYDVRFRMCPIKSRHWALFSTS